ncbi:2-hydroxymuconic semialdehyde dehydrogenase [Marinomonas ostreistagni]|uniref:2-hydroxymuconic semialdehyde dehydrogenase n=1 Tax=Marinomonas ostreistagni TaxID=359209 RepID=A0ABS0ZFV2_9GAMM|nr:2-hydroxymuconic semialdehyde dehydrogenase [Marinomonas ostreistagni]MBJ7552557.1 2-hydroxymuconic semialdehyde dehydrogenase [Marinomonas ostreistagni]
MKHIQHFINGMFVDSISQRSFSKLSPVDGRQIAAVQEADEEDVAKAVSAAKAALKGEWGQMTQRQRAEKLEKVAQRIIERFDEFLEAECADTGKPKSLASHIDIPRGAANFTAFSHALGNEPTETFSMDTPDGSKAINLGLRKPKGVIAVICPWNLPLLLMTWKVGPALACGNTVVVKPSEVTPTTAALLGDVMNECGIPAGVYNVVHGFGAQSAGQYLTQNPDVDAITFTGETSTGESIMQAAALGLRNISLECGGKNSAIVFEDCDMHSAVEGVLRSAFENTGQVCLGTERVYVQSTIFEEFLHRLKERVSELKLGPPDMPNVNLGPLASLEHQLKVLSYYDLAKKDGAQVVIGGGVPNLGASLDGGAWVEPTIWVGLDRSSKVLQEEIFGPCCHVQPFDDEREVIALANDTNYGLCASVWTQNIQRAMTVSHSLDVGIVWVNSWFLRDLRTAFGGAKQSGIGREGGVHGLEFYTELQNVCIKYDN